MDLINSPGGRALAAVLVLASALAGCGGAQSRKAHFVERGKEYLAQGRFDKAGIEFRNALQIAPNDPVARFESGEVAEHLAAYPAAASFYQGALDVSPDYLDARRRLARLLLLGGRFQQALDTAAPGLAKHPDDAPLLAIRASARSRMQSDVTEAVADAERSVRLDRHNPEAVEILAGLYQRQKRDSDALDVLHRGVADNPGSIDLKLALAQHYNTHQQPAEAERLLHEIIAQAPADPRYRVLLARQYASRNQLDEAETTLHEGLKALPHSPPLSQALIEFLSARRGEAAVEREVHSQLAANPNDDDLRFILADLLAGSGKPDEARDVYRSIVDRHGSKAAQLRAQSALAQLRLAAQDVSGAQQLAGEVLAADPRNSDALQVRARIALLQGRPQDAILDLRNILKDAPNDPKVLRLLAAAHRANREPALALGVLQDAAAANPGDPAIKLELVAQLIEQGKADEAQSIAEVLRRGEPRNPTILRSTYRAQVAHKDFAAALATAETLEQVLPAPEKSAALVMQGNAAEGMQKLDLAVARLEKAQSLDPAGHEPLEALVRVYGLQGKTAAALERLSRFEASQPKDPLPRVLGGEVLLAERKFAEAGQSFSAAIALDPKWLPSYRGLSKVQLEQKNVDGAVATLRSAERQVAQPDLAAQERALLLQSLGRTDEAAAAYEDALRENPKADVVANNLAMLLVTSRSDPQSLDRALALTRRFADSPNPLHLDTLGWVHFKRGENADALQVLGKALQMAPDASAIRYHLAMAQLKTGATATARENLAQALKPGINFEGAGDARSTLASLGATVSTLPH